MSLAELEERYLQTDLQVLMGINSKEHSVSKAAFAEAGRFQSQHALFDWIHTQNDAKRIAPSTTMLQNHLVRHAVEPGATAAQRSAKGKQVVSVSWVQRFRKRWGMTRGRFMPGERMAAETIHDKVTMSKEKTALLSAIISRTLFFVAVKKGGRYAAPKQGPQ